eukprot:CAMPEP_0183703890 /NCGR_PEP_ID=MMETSP0737-20130205/1447_1 /TAXON_ID=385413 /ORGANISM="Thalassiosira miniscula, Strain CCMP1093" /LENGTH=205 /DNA_ID=CAMNT_0025930691 /DNA_START=57 /DNA_END=674 /DNA_ORIENTATION=-
MMKTACLLALVGSAAAFAPAPTAQTSTALNADFKNELGVQAPLGYFDPLGYLKDADQSTFDGLRHRELKHGRVAMLAVVGYLTTASGYRFPGFPEDVPAGFGAWHALAQTQDGKSILVQMAVFFVLAEIVNRPATWAGYEGEFPGDYRNGFDFGWDKKSDAWKAKRRAVELNNGRAAMMGIFGLVTHEFMGGPSLLPGGILPGSS